jgi:hypothetical protein
MSTITIDASTPSAAVNFAVLRAFCERILTMSRLNQIKLGNDEYQLVWEIVNAASDGKTATGTTTQAVLTY